ncbi:MAG: DNA cytosine methyltransferase [Desulfobacteraceae bacterium]|nr:DNA cytosine methyltransferase [Desulfobacteraceae bacterium]
MKINQVSYMKVGKGKSGDKRLWMEGKRMALSGFEKGKAYKSILDLQYKRIDLVLDEGGDKKVSGRKRYGKVLPIIDLCNSTITQYIKQVLGNVDRVRVVFMNQRIRISIHQDDQKKLDREEQTRANLIQGILSEATLCVGGGISSYALHKGFNEAGLHAVSEFVVDMDGRYLQNAIDNNPFITDDTVIFEATLEEMEPVLIKKSMKGKSLDILNISLPCTGHSKAGKVKNKLTHAEEHTSAGTAIIGLLNIIQATNPSSIISENVPQFKNSATKAILEGFLRKSGYQVYEAILGRELGAFEDRNRHIIIALSSGLAKDFQREDIQPSSIPPETLEEVLDDIPDDSPMWQSFESLAKKEQRDKENGKSFKRQLLNPKATKVGAIGKGYNKRRSTEPFLLHPTAQEKSRLLTVGEHARVKNIPEDAVANRSITMAHEILGQSVLFPVFKSLGKLIGTHLRDVALDEPENKEIINHLQEIIIESKDFRETQIEEGDAKLLFFENLRMAAQEVRQLSLFENMNDGLGM